MQELQYKGVQEWQECRRMMQGGITNRNSQPPTPNSQLSTINY
jgi:hypothetical protein